MNRLWSLLFFFVTAGGLAAFVFAAIGAWPLNGAWLPENFSESGKAIDELFYIVTLDLRIYFCFDRAFGRWVRVAVWQAAERSG